MKMNPNWKESAADMPQPTAEPAMPAAPAAGGSMPQMMIHSHEGGNTVHIHHADGKHEKHKHSHGDAEGMAAHVLKHFGGTSSAPEPEQKEQL